MISIKNCFDKIDEKILLLAIIGTLETVKQSGITIDETEKFIFSPHMISELQEKVQNKKIIELIMKGCELEDIASLIPEKLNEIIDELKEEAITMVKSYDEYNKNFWIV